MGQHPRCQKNICMYGQKEGPVPQLCTPYTRQVEVYLKRMVEHILI